MLIPECSPAMTSRSGIAWGEGSSRVGEFPVSDIAGKMRSFCALNIRPQRQLNAPIPCLTSTAATTTIENYVKAVFSPSGRLPTAPSPRDSSQESTLVPGTANHDGEGHGQSAPNTNPVCGSNAHDQKSTQAGHRVRRHRLQSKSSWWKVSKLDWGEIHEDAEVEHSGLGSYAGENRRTLCNYPEFDPLASRSHRLMAHLQAPPSIRVVGCPTKPRAYHPARAWIKRLPCYKVCHGQRPDPRLDH